ncbi:MAG: hypothetical protein ACRC1Y_02165 [Paraclostridium sp.]
MHIKKLLVLPIISSLLITGCIKDDIGKEDKKEQPKQEETQVKTHEEEIKEALQDIIKGDYKGAELKLVVALSEDENNEDLSTLYRQVKTLLEIEEKIKEKKYDEARVSCNVLLLEEKIDKVIVHEAERLQEELDKLDINKLSGKNRNVKIDKNKDITPQKAMDIVTNYINTNYPGNKPKVYIADMYSMDNQSYYYIYAYIIKNTGGQTKEEGIGYYDVNMKNGKIIEYLICDPNYKINISEDKAIELSRNYMAKYTDYKAESFKVLNIASECGDTFYCIEAYGRDINNSLINVGYFEVHVESGIVRGDVYPPEVKDEESNDLKQPLENENEDKETETREDNGENLDSEIIESDTDILPT